METLKINSGIKKYAIENEDGKVVAELLIDTNDDSIMGKMMDLYDSLTALEKKVQKSLDEAEGIDETEDTKTFKKFLKVSTDATNEIIEQTEEIFGKGLFSRIYAENYKNNPSFIPSIDSLKEFYEQAFPLVTSLFAERQNKYSVVKGK